MRVERGRGYSGNQLTSEATIKRPDLSDLDRLTQDLIRRVAALEKTVAELTK